MTDNAIKNHWNSLVKKILDMYLAAGLLSQFQGPPLVSYQNQSVASSFSKAQQSSKDDSVVKDRVEVEEIREETPRKKKEDRKPGMVGRKTVDSTMISRKRRQWPGQRGVLHQRGLSSGKA
ncbi:Transcription factor [Forsythia ovata]|uniref:Transcription factor n=1 Tax=Forsythia ovata TaxID=205694 RepID=A0ABD1X1V7_9LAMI